MARLVVVTAAASRSGVFRYRSTLSSAWGCLSRKTSTGREPFSWLQATQAGTRFDGRLLPPRQRATT